MIKRCLDILNYRETRCYQTKNTPLLLHERMATHWEYLPYRWLFKAGTLSHIISAEELQDGISFCQYYIFIERTVKYSFHWEMLRGNLIHIWVTCCSKLVYYFLFVCLYSSSFDLFLFISELDNLREVSLCYFYSISCDVVMMVQEYAKSYSRKQLLFNLFLVLVILSTLS